MKTIFLMLLISISVKSYGQVLLAPAPLTNSQIERKLETGEVQKFDGDEWMIVKRTAPKKKKVVPPPVEIVKTVESTKTVEVVKEIPPLKNRMSLLIGQGPRAGMDKEEFPSEMSATTKVGTILALQYQRLTDITILDMPLSGLIQLQTNESAFLGAGLDF